MQRWIVVACLMALLMYAGFAAQRQQAASGPPPDLSGLRQALAATGADLKTVMILGGAQVASPAVKEQLALQLGWKGQATPSDETREIRGSERDGIHYVGIRWVLAGKALLGWEARADQVRKALAELGADSVVTVQLEGVTARQDLLSLGNQALDAVRASARQPWSDENSASIAGQAKLLPAGPFGVNVQVAARRSKDGKSTRVWVAWPALQQEY